MKKFQVKFTLPKGQAVKVVEATDIDSAELFAEMMSQSLLNYIVTELPSEEPPQQQEEAQ